jgi:hypothetical protein
VSKLIDFKQQAERCRRLARETDSLTRERLLQLAAEYDTKAEAGRTATEGNLD